MAQKRAEALAKATRCQFYESDRVKQFHRIVLLTETLKERDEQIEMKQRMKNASNEETKKFTPQVSRQELEAVEQKCKRTRRQEKEKADFTEYMRQQLMDQNLVKQLSKLERDKELKECQQLREKYAREKAQLWKTQQEGKESIRKAHETHVLMRDAIRAKEAEKDDMEEKRRKLVNKENEMRMRRKKEEKGNKYRQLERRKQRLAGHLSTHLQEKAVREKARDAETMAQAKAQLDAELECECQEMAKKKAMISAIAKRREDTCRMQEQRAAEEQQSARNTLEANKEADCAYWEEQQLKREKKKADRFSMDETLRQQMAEKSSKNHLVKKELTDFERKTAQRLMEDDAQFQQYAAGLIRVATEANRNTCSLRKAVNQDIVCGLGPITGGIRSNYLVSRGASHSRVPKYLSSTKQDIKSLYNNSDTQNNRRLDFIWQR
ncbi:hypothetical protein AAFF_G00194990 [Aldrovandia affinis]|uniref:Trichohyalin-plectin-homology domain-containing protein n=1 Tax=Aldrovandia affinis TaxID=143900 RepID=A0AAD7WVK0_9TELE|nr:hypothetical protein AAFF_G00194990 [Aldrovandia affinis]